MTNRFIIYCCPGAAGLFLTSVFAKIMEINVSPSISATGNSHNLGNGDWKEIPSINLLGDHYESNYRPGCPIYFAHRVGTDFWQQNPNIKSVYINIYPSEYRKVARILVKKAWPTLWTQDEYNKWVSPNYPPYSSDNIATSELICNDLVDDLSVTTVQKWCEDNKNRQYDYTIDFKTIMGLDGYVLDQVVAEIVQQPTTKDIHQFVVDYQILNQRLYFNDKQS